MKIAMMSNRKCFYSRKEWCNILSSLTSRVCYNYDNNNVTSGFDKVLQTHVLCETGKLSLGFNTRFFVVLAKLNGIKT